ncbi:unnamed protein product [Closterium sp. Naga37s-1]|nr:unnamed protein product [Closterium sp. Naga37s-1]
MAEQTYNSDMTMSPAEEEALGASGKDLAVDDMPEGMFHHLAEPADLPAAKKPCMDPVSRNAPNSSPSTSSGSAPAMPAYSPAPLAAAALTAPRLAWCLRRQQLLQQLPTPRPPAQPPTRPSPQPPSWLQPGLESHRSEILAGVNAQLCGFMFASGIIHSVEQTVGDPYRVARRVYGRLLFSWPSQEDAAAFRKLFPLTLKVSNSCPLLLKVFEDRFAAFTAAKDAGAPTLSIRNVPLDFDPEDIRAYPLGSTEPDGSHWPADLTDFHRALDPYEDTYITHLVGLPVANPNDPDFERIPSEIPLEENKPPMLLNFSSHVCALCANNHRAADHEAFAARRRQRLTNRNVISVAQLQKANGTPLAYPSRFCYSTFPLPFRSGSLAFTILPSISSSLSPCYTYSPLSQRSSSPSPHSTPLLPHPPLFSRRLGVLEHLRPPPSFTLPLPTLCPAVNTPSRISHPPPVSSAADPLHSHELPPPAQPPPTPASPHSLPVQPHPLGPIPHLGPGLWPFAPHCTHPTPLLTPHSCPPLPTTSPTGTLRCLFPLSPSALSPPSSPIALSSPCNILGNHAAPTTFRNDPGLLYVGLDDKVETWTCALCDFTCGAALDSAMVHIQSAMHTSRVKAMAHRPAAKEAFGPWSAQKPSVAAFLRG